MSVWIALLGLAGVQAVEAPSASTSQPISAVTESPEYPSELRDQVRAYSECLNDAASQLKAGVSAEVGFKQGIADCSKVREAEEESARKMQIDGWPKAGTTERVAAVTELFDKFDQAHVADGRTLDAISAQIAARQSGLTNAPNP